MIKPAFRTIRKSAYGFDFAVLAPPERPDLFFMNMKVFRLEPVSDEREGGNSILIWRAIRRVGSTPKS